MSDYTIRLQLNPKPGPRSRVDWDCWIDGFEEDGTEHGPTAADALRYLAERLENEDA